LSANHACTRCDVFALFRLVQDHFQRLQTVFELVGTGGPYAPGGAVSPKIDEILNKVRAMAATDPARNGLMRDLAREVSEQAATLPVISRANVYAYKPGCISNLVPYLPSGDDRFNDVHVMKGCK